MLASRLRMCNSFMRSSMERSSPKNFLPSLHRVQLKAQLFIMNSGLLSHWPFAAQPVHLSSSSLQPSSIKSGSADSAILA